MNPNDENEWEYRKTKGTAAFVALVALIVISLLGV